MMKTLVETYRGARIYKMEQDAEGEGKLINVQLMAKGHIHHMDNLQKDFTTDGADLSKALEKIRKDIDLYLKKHNLNTFAHDG